MSIDDDEYSFPFDLSMIYVDAIPRLIWKLGVIVPTQVIFIAADILHKFLLCFQYPYQALATT